MSKGKGLKMWKKGLAAGAAVCLMCGGSAFSAFAGSWQQDASGWWWQEDDGSYPASQWKWIDGDGDSVSECYYFDGAGYCLTDGTAPDGSQVNGSGAWVVNGVVQVSQTGSAAGDAAGSGVYGELSYEDAKARLLAYYNNLLPDDGNYVIMDSESAVSDKGYTFIVRYQMSDREAQERISRGGFPAANILAGQAVVDKYTGIASLDSGEEVDLRQ